MFTRKNGMNSINILNTRSHKISNTLLPIEGEILKQISTYLNWAKYYEINICHSDVQKYVFHEK